MYGFVFFFIDVSDCPHDVIARSLKPSRREKEKEKIKTQTDLEAKKHYTDGYRYELKKEKKKIKRNILIDARGKNASLQIRYSTIT